MHTGLRRAAKAIDVPSSGTNLSHASVLAPSCCGRRWCQLLRAPGGGIGSRGPLAGTRATAAGTPASPCWWSAAWASTLATRHDGGTHTRLTMTMSMPAARRRGAGCAPPPSALVPQQHCLVGLPERFMDRALLPHPPLG